MSQLEELKKTRTELEEEALRLKAEKKQCEDTVMEFEQKIAIAELRRDNKLTRDSISQLRSRMNELDQKLREVSQNQEAQTTEQKAEPETPKHEPAEDEYITVTTSADSAEEIQQEQPQSAEHKRHRFF